MKGIPEIVRSTMAAAAVSLLWPAASQAQFEISLSPDQRIVEGDSGTSPVTFLASLNGSSPSVITVNYRTLAGSATSPSDFVTVSSGVVTFNPGELSKPLNLPQIQVQNDLVSEWSSTLQQDEVFYVELYNPVNASIRRGKSSITVIDNDYPQPGVQFLSVVTDTTGTNANQGRNRLQFRVPAAQSSPTQILIAWTSGSSTCTPPDNEGNGEAPGPALVNLLATDAGKKMTWTHNIDTPPNFPVQFPRVYCYSVFVKYAAVATERAEAAVQTFDASAGPVKWTYTPGYYFGSPAPNVVPPTVGADAIYTVGTDGVVHAMQRGSSGGIWPPTWEPVGLGKPAHNRSPIVPLAEGPRLFVGTESGEVHAIDGRTGAIVWSRSQRFGTSQLMPGASTGVQATPAGLFKAWGGENDLILVGTSTGVGNTKFFALSPATGATIDDFPNGGDSPPGPIDNVLGMAVVDYGVPNRVYFGTTGSALTLWSLDLGVAGTPDLTMSGLAWSPKPLGAVSGTMGSGVSRGGRLYLDVDTGPAASLYALVVATGTLYAPYNHGDGSVKGFVWPDRRDDRLYFSTNNNVHGVRDNGTALVTLWTPISVTSPSIPLQRPGTDDLFVGDGNGRLLKINVATKALTPIQLTTAGVQIGAPSLDVFHNLIHVGSAKGVVYAVRP